MVQNAKGMVSFGGMTYRVEKIAHDRYEVVRILDDRRIGAFAREPNIQVMPEGVDSGLLREIAHLALRQGKISWAGRLEGI